MQDPSPSAEALREFHAWLTERVRRWNRRLDATDNHFRLIAKTERTEADTILAVLRRTMARHGLRWEDTE